MRILIAEDDVTSRNILQAALREGGHEVVGTVNGAEAWTALQREDSPRLAILDWLMPEMDGLEVVHRVRALQTEQPPYIIMLTIKGEKADIVAGLDAGANDYLAKPFDADELRARVEVGRRMIEMQAAMASKNDELRQALDQVKTLRGIVPICSHCKKVRDSKGYWQQVDVYIRDHTEAEFSHSLCENCIRELYPDEAKEVISGAKDEKPEE